jgi:signal transduction histidine kinase
MDGDIKSVGNIQEIVLYNSSSKYYNQRWALISVADENSVLKLYNTTLNTSYISALISLVIGIAMLVIISKRITSPIVHIIEKLNTKKDYNEIVKFDSSNISEIDQLTDAITSLQVNVKEYSSRVSKIISMTDMGMGVFTINCNDNMVFVSESLITLLRLKNLPPEDSFIEFNKFTNYIENSFPDK